MQHPILILALALAVLSSLLCLRQVQEHWIGLLGQIELWLGMAVLARLCAQALVTHLAAGTASAHWRVGIARTSVAAEASGPALLLLAALALLEAGIVSRRTVYLAGGATLGSGVFTAWQAIAPLMPYYPQYPLSTHVDRIATASWLARLRFFATTERLVQDTASCSRDRVATKPPV